MQRLRKVNTEILRITQSLGFDWDLAASIKFATSTGTWFFTRRITTGEHASGTLQGTFSLNNFGNTSLKVDAIAADRSPIEKLGSLTIENPTPERAADLLETAHEFASTPAIAA